MALDEGDAAVAESGEVIEGVACGGEVVELDGDEALAVLVAGDGDDGHGEVVVHGGIDRDDAFDGAREEEARVSLEEIGAVVVADDEVEIFLLEERIFNAAEDGGGVAFADFRNHDADGEAALVAELARNGIGFVVEERGGLQDSFLSFWRDAVFDSGIVHDA